MKEIPVIPRLPDDWVPPSMDPNPVVAICGECGIQLRQVMHYCCQNSRCPCFTRVTC